MDRAQAQAFVARIHATESISGWTIHEFLGAGKSAVVLRATRSGVEAAVKVFHPEVIDRYGRAAQLARLDRESRLVGVKFPGLV